MRSVCGVHGPQPFDAGQGAGYFQTMSARLVFVAPTFGLNRLGVAMRAASTLQTGDALVCVIAAHS